jgi:hypothetical protein
MKSQKSAPIASSSLAICFFIWDQAKAAIRLFPASRKARASRKAWTSRKGLTSRKARTSRKVGAQGQFQQYQ